MYQVSFCFFLSSGISYAVYSSMLYDALFIFSKMETIIQFFVHSAWSSVSVNGTAEPPRKPGAASTTPDQLAPTGYIPG